VYTLRLIILLIRKFVLICKFVLNLKIVILSSKLVFKQLFLYISVFCKIEFLGFAKVSFHPDAHI